MEKTAKACSSFCITQSHSALTLPVQVDKEVSEGLESPVAHALSALLQGHPVCAGCCCLSQALQVAVAQGQSKACLLVVIQPRAVPAYLRQSGAVATASQKLVQEALCTTKLSQLLKCTCKQHGVVLGCAGKGMLVTSNTEDLSLCSTQGDKETTCKASL